MTSRFHQNDGRGASGAERGRHQARAADDQRQIVKMYGHSALARAHRRRLCLRADDFVKVRVWLGSNYHVLSRFLITRLLTVTKVRAFEIDRGRLAQSPALRFPIRTPCASRSS